MIQLYFDPGFGAMLVQGFVALIAGILLFSKNLLFKVKSFFGLVKPDKEEDVYDDFEDKNEQIK